MGNLSPVNLTYGYDGNGNLLTVTNGTATVTRAYDALNRLTSYTDASNNTITYAYDANNNLASLTFGGNKTVTYAYDARNMVSNVTDWNGHVTTLAYDVAGRLVKVTRPNGTTRSLSYDLGDQLVHVDERLANSTVLGYFEYQYDQGGRIKTELDVPAPQSYSITMGNATYDSDNRLAAFNGNTVSCDANGNMLSGPLLSNATANYTFDARNRLLTAGNVTNASDLENNRVSYAVAGNTTSFVIDPNGPLSRVLLRTKPGNVTTYYVYAGSLLL